MLRRFCCPAFIKANKTDDMTCHISNVINTVSDKKIGIDVNSDNVLLPLFIMCFTMKI